MSIVNIVIERDRALVGVDTLTAYLPGIEKVMTEAERHGRQSCKVSFLPQINCAWTGRGDSLLMSLVYMNLVIGCVRNFEHAVSAMPELLNQAYATATAIRLEKHSKAFFPGVDAVLVGWNTAMMRFEGWRWIRRTEADEFVATRIDTWLALPEVDRVQHVDIPNTDAKMEALARKQMAWATANYPGTCGGNLIIAELTRGAIDVRTIANLDLRQSLPAASLPSPQNSRDGSLFSHNREKPTGAIDSLGPGRE